MPKRILLIRDPAVLLLIPPPYGLLSVLPVLFVNVPGADQLPGMTLVVAAAVVVMLALLVAVSFLVVALNVCCGNNCKKNLTRPYL